MTLRHSLLAACAAAVVAGCSSGSSEPGIDITLKAVAQGTPAHDHGGPAEPVAIFRRDDGMKIELEVGQVNLVPVELQRCSGVRAAALLEALNPIGRAMAHGDAVEGNAPEGAISVIPADGGEFDLGTLTAEPGQYCGLVVEIRAGADATQPMIDVAPCYYPGTQNLSDAAALAATTHSCTQVTVGGAARRVTLPFSAPVTLDKDRKTLALSVVTRYEEWFNGIDFALITSTEQRERLVSNILASLYAVTGAEQNVALGFKLAVDGQEAVCGQTYEGLGSTAQPLRLEGLRFYVSNLALRNAAGEVPVNLRAPANGTVLQTATDHVALLGHTQGCDAPVRVRQLVLTGTAPAGTYDQVCFDLGVPYTLGHTDVSTAPSPLNVTGMDWTWLFGRMFFRFDGVADPDGASPSNFFVHLGSTGCSNGAAPDFGAPPSEECVYPNRPRICLDYAEIATGHPIVADLAPLISEVDITKNTPDTAPGCMSEPGDPECATVLPKFNLDFALGETTLVPRRNQALFTVGE